MDGFANRNGNGPDGVNGFGGAGGAFFAPTTSVTVRLVPGLPAGAYEVRVIGLGANGLPVGTFSDGLTVVINTVLTPANGRPTITLPAGGTPLPVGTLARFTWTGVVGVVEYLFEFTGPNRDFANPNGTSRDAGALGSVIVPGTTFEVPIPPGLAPGTYRVRVIARTRAGQFIGTFSDAVAVTIP